MLEHRRRTKGAGTFLATAFLAAAGCGGGGGTPDPGGDPGACPVGGTGSFVVHVQGLPAGATAPLQLGGGDLSQPKLLTDGVAVQADAGPGFYVEWRRAVLGPAANSVVGRVFSLSPVTFDGCIKANATTTVTLTYFEEPGSGKMWVTAVNPPVDGRVFAGFDGTDVATSGTKSPVVWKSNNTTGRGGAGAFDNLGNFWLPAGDRINMYAMSTLGTTSAAAPDVTITQPPSASANFAAFDAYGSLWVSRGAPTADVAVVRYLPSELTTSGSPTPSVALRSIDFTNPTGIAFDSSGNLWVADSGNDAVLKFAPARLTASYAGPADAVITTRTAHTAPIADAPYTSPIPLAFDQSGNLLIGYIGNIVKLTPAQQAASADIGGPFALDVPGGTGMFAFDQSGGLWLPGPDAGQFARLPASAFTTGDTTPDIVIDSADLGGAETIVLDPAPTWSGINQL
jgi:hypothetical protein